MTLAIATLLMNGIMEIKYERLPLSEEQCKRYKLTRCYSTNYRR